MKTLSKSLISIAVLSASAGTLVHHQAGASELSEAVASGKASVNLRLRYEDVGQDNAAEDASALTLRTLLSYTTGTYKNFSAKVEMEDNRIVFGQGDFTG